MKFLPSVAVLTIMISMSSCGSGDDQTASQKADPEPTTPLVVSDETTCRQLFNNDEPLLAATDIVVKFSTLEEIGTDDIDPEEATDVADTLRRISDRASDELKPSVAVLADRLDVIVKYMNSGGGDAVDIDDVQAAGFEITSICKQYPGAVSGD